MNIALLNIDCLSSAKSIETILKKHQKEIKLLIITDPNRGSLQFFLSQVIRHLTHSGMTFTSYLFCNFVLHRILTHSSYFWAQIKKTPPAFTPLKKLCQELGIRYLQVNDVNTPEVVNVLKELQIDLVTVYYFDQILREPFIQTPKWGVVNFHPAPLPKCRGLHPVIYSASRNNQEFAVTAHEITDRRIDAGAILAQTPLYHSKGLNLFQLEEAVNLSGVKLYSQVIENFHDLLQSKYLQGSGSYFSHPSRKDVSEIRKQGYQFINIKTFIKRYFQDEPTSSVLTEMRG